MPVYMFQQAEINTENPEEIEKKKRRLTAELDSAEVSSKPAVNKLKRYVISREIWHVSEWDYRLRMEYEKYLERVQSHGSVSLYLHVFDQIKQYEIAQQVKTLAGKHRCQWQYKNEILYLKYHPDAEVAKLFETVRNRETLVWDFTLKCPEKMKRQIFICMNQVIAVTQNDRFRQQRLMALKRFYNFCAKQKIEDISMLEWDEVELFRNSLGESGNRTRENCQSIVGFCRKTIYMKADTILWDSTVWYIERFHFTQDRMSEYKSLESISFMEVRQKENRKILQIYMKYEFGVTGQAVSTIIRRFTFIRNFLVFLDEEMIPVTNCTGAEVEKYMLQLGEKGMKSKAYNDELYGNSHFFKFMEVRGFIKKVPFRPEYFMQKVVHSHNDRSVEQEIYMEILLKLHLFPEHLRCMFLHLWCLGLRASEVCTLKGNAYYRQGQDCWIQVYQVKMKNYKRIPIPEALYRVMEVYLKKNQIGIEDYIFQNKKGGPCLYQTFRHQMIKACGENQIENGMYIFKSHDYRHTVATMFYDKNVSIQSIRDYLGHTYEEMTRQYIDYMPQRIAEANEEFFSSQENSLAACLGKGDCDGA